MHPRAKQLIESLALAPHPEGGWYRQLFKSEFDDFEMQPGPI